LTRWCSISCCTGTTFSDRSTPAAGLVSDGLFHAFGWFATVPELFLFADLRRHAGIWPARWWSGLLLGASGFLLYDVSGKL
jgi:uncharacterized membrane protein